MPTNHVLIMQAIATKQLSFVVDPCLDHTPSPAPTPSTPNPPAAKPGTKLAAKSALGSAAADKTSRSLVQAFQQDILPAYGKEWTGITGNASFLPTDAQYAQLLNQAAGVVYCGLGSFLQHIPPAVVAQADMRGCELAVVLDGAQTVQSVRRQLAVKG